MALLNFSHNVCHLCARRIQVSQPRGLVREASTIAYAFKKISRNQNSRNKKQRSHFLRTPPDGIHPYPYGPSRIYKQSNLGLYGGRKIQFGNNVSDNPKGPTKTRRTWKPNIQQKSIWSDALGRSVRMRVATRVIRTIDKVGGLDNYLLDDRPVRIKELGPTGWALRQHVLNTEKIQTIMEQQRVELNMPSKKEFTYLTVRKALEKKLYQVKNGMEGVPQAITEAAYENAIRKLDLDWKNDVESRAEEEQEDSVEEEASEIDLAEQSQDDVRFMQEGIEKLELEDRTTASGRGETVR